MEELTLLLIVLGAFVWQAKIVHQQRSKIKERANEEFEKDIDPTIDELQSRLGESELQYESLEDTYWLHIGMFSGVASHLYWHHWYISIPIAISIWVVGGNYLTLKPFASGIAGK